MYLGMQRSLSTNVLDHQFTTPKAEISEVAGYLYGNTNQIIEPTEIQVSSIINGSFKEKYVLFRNLKNIFEKCLPNILDTFKNVRKCWEALVGSQIGVRVAACNISETTEGRFYHLKYKEYKSYLDFLIFFPLAEQFSSRNPVVPLEIKKIFVNVPNSHLSLQHNFKQNTLWNIKKINNCNDESVEPTSSTEAIFYIIGTFGTIQL